MSSTDVQVMPAYMARVRKLYPGAVGVGRVTVLRNRRAELRKLERRGEIVCIERFTKEVRPGVLEVPYVQLKERSQVRREQALKAGVALLAGTAAAYGIGWLIWESRFVIMLLAAALAGSAGLAYLSLHWRNGCSGIHCAGCWG